MNQTHLSRHRHMILKTFALGLCICQMPLSFGETLPIPKLTYEYGIVLDYQCDDMMRKITIKPGIDQHTEIMKEARSLTAPLQKQWDEQGPEILNALFGIVGKPYPRKELLVYTSACKKGGMSTPFIVGIRAHLKSTSKKPVPLTLNMVITIHEFIHRYLVATFDSEHSKILKEFGDKPALFKNHLHLMALMKRAFVLANREDLVNFSEMLYVKIIGGVYGETWSIGTSEEFQERLIEETRLPRRPRSGKFDYWAFDPKKKKDK